MPQPPPRFSETWTSVLLDLLRGLAALLVLMDHWRNLLFVNFHEIGGQRLWFAVPYLLTAAAHEAVVIFFVLSGLLIGGAVWRAFERAEWNWTSYLTHRLVRLWIVLLPALVLCLLWDEIGTALAASASYPPLQSSRGDSALVFAGNVLFLQGVLVPAFGSDGPLWSLANEFWYYVLFPLGLAAVLPSARYGARIVGAALFLVLCLGLRTLLPLFPIWLLGAALFKLPCARLGPGLRSLAAAAYVPMIFLCTHLHGIIGIGSDYLLAAATAALLWTLLGNSAVAPAAAASVRFSRGLARFSYTLYVTHFPILMLIAGFAVGAHRWQPTGLHIAQGLCILAAVLAYAYGIAFITEFHTARVRRWVQRRLGGPAASFTRDGL